MVMGYHDFFSADSQDGNLDTSVKKCGEESCRFFVLLASAIFPVGFKKWERRFFGLGGGYARRPGDGPPPQ